jgi:cellulose synthase (UDP-forming)
MWAGLAPVFMKATLQAVLSGPKRKPVYTVTRKHSDLRWHWKHTLPQTTIVLTILAVLIYALRFNTFPSPILLIGSVYWGGLNIILLGNFITRSWYGLTSAPSLIRRPSQSAGAGQPSNNTA